MKELGGHCCVLNASNAQLSRGESIEDVVADCVVIRNLGHERLLKLAKCFDDCIINALTDRSHPYLLQICPSRGTHTAYTKGKFDVLFRF